ncbi:MAG: hypothetical protein ACLFQX_00570 [Candidatus Kapaibacterium sp.]
MFRTAMLILMFAIAAIMLSGCLSVEKKEYTLELKDGGKGTATVRYINIVSVEEDDKDVSDKDFQTLIEDWMVGEEIDNQFEKARVVDKKLFIENDILIAEVKVEFDSLMAMGLYQYDKNSPYMKLFCPDFTGGGNYESSNGRFPGEDFPAVIWPSETKTFKWTLVQMEDMTGASSLADEYKAWKEKEGK